MLKRCAIILLLLATTALFAWLATCASCTAPELRLAEWQPPTHCGVGQPFRLELHAYGGLTPPNDALFHFHTLDNAECQQPLSWRPAGICSKGLRWKTTLVTWPINVGAFEGIIATYLPQDEKIALPDAMITPSGDLLPVWLDSPQKSHLVDIALCITLLFCVLPFFLPWAKALCTGQVHRLDASLLERLRRIQHPAAPCLAYLLSRRNIATYSSHKENLDTLEAYCRKLI